MSRPPAITFHSFPRSLSRCVLQHQRQLFWVFILFFFSYDFVVCRLWQNSSKYPTLPGFLMSSVYVDLAFQHSACFSFTFDVVMHRSTFSPAASVFVCVCATACVRNIYTCSSCWQRQERFSELCTLRPSCTTHCAHCIARTYFHCVLYRVFVVLFVCLLLAEADKETQCEGRRGISACQCACEMETYFIDGEQANSLMWFYLLIRSFFYCLLFV